VFTKPSCRLTAGDKQKSGSKWMSPTDASAPPSSGLIDPDDTETDK
jgi:hypothetical protein